MASMTTVASMAIHFNRLYRRGSVVVSIYDTADVITHRGTENIDIDLVSPPSDWDRRYSSRRTIDMLRVGGSDDGTTHRACGKGRC